jgi:hypothetical protein
LRGDFAPSFHDVNTRDVQCRSSLCTNE